MSRGVPPRPSGVSARIRSRSSSSIQPVSTGPGLTTLAVEPQVRELAGGGDHQPVQGALGGAVRQVAHDVVAGQRDDPAGAVHGTRDRSAYSLTSSQDARTLTA